MVFMKICYKCNIEKDLDEFYRHPGMSDGRVNKCKECNKKDVRTNYAVRKDYYNSYDKSRQRLSKRRIFLHRYNQIRQRVNGKATRKYRVEGSQMLTYSEYGVWLIDNMDTFETIYVQWEKSNFSRKLAPSIDRIDNSKGYVANNMRWTTVSDNSRKFNKSLHHLKSGGNYAS